MFNRGYAPTVNPNLVVIINPIPPFYIFCIALEVGTGDGEIALEIGTGSGCIALELGSQTI